MNGMRRVGRCSAKKTELEDCEELDFDQEIEELVEADENTGKVKPQFEDADTENLPVYQQVKPSKELVINMKTPIVIPTNLPILNTSSNPGSQYNSGIWDDKICLDDIKQIRKDSSQNNLFQHIKVPLKLNINDGITTLPDPALLEVLNDDEDAISSHEDAEYDVYRNEEKERRSVYVKNVDFSATPEDLEMFFRSCGEINRITILVDKYTGLPKGYAFIEFSDTNSKDKAKGLNDSIFLGRQIKVDDKRKNLPDYYGEKTKKFNRPVYSTENYIRGSNAYFGPLKGKYMPFRNFNPY